LGFCAARAFEDRAAEIGVGRVGLPSDPAPALEAAAFAFAAGAAELFARAAVPDFALRATVSDVFARDERDFAAEDDRAADDFLAGDFLAAGFADDFFAVVLAEEDRAVVFAAEDFLAGAFFAVAFAAEDFFAAGLAEDFFAVVLAEEDRAVVFAAEVFFAGDFFAAGLAEDLFAPALFAFALADAVLFAGPLFAAPDPDRFRAGALFEADFAAAATASAASLVDELDRVEPRAALPSAARRPVAGASPRFRERRTGRERGRLERTSRWVLSAIG
jgi:hypothetical protein